MASGVCWAQSAGLVLLAYLAATQGAWGAEPVFAVVPVAEKTLPSLPGGPLFWRVERFTTTQEAARNAAPHALVADNGGETWRFTLGPFSKAEPVGNAVATIGPVPKPVAHRYLLRINRAGGPPGVKTPVHTHPGSEAFYVLAGRLCQRTEHGTTQLDAGHAMNGHVPGMIMQLQSCGTGPLDQFVMFVVDAAKPFSTAASFR